MYYSVTQHQFVLTVVCQAGLSAQHLLGSDDVTLLGGDRGTDHHSVQELL